MGNLVTLLLKNQGTIINVIQLLRQGIEVAPEVIGGLKNEWEDITGFLSENRDPTDDEMNAIIERRKSLEDSILAIDPKA